MARSLDLTRASEQLGPSEAVKLQRVDLRTSRHVVTRGKGYARVDFTTGEGATVNGAGILRRRDGAVILIFGSTAGAWKFQVKPNMAYTDANY